MLYESRNDSLFAVDDVRNVYSEIIIFKTDMDSTGTVAIITEYDKSPYWLP